MVFKLDIRQSGHKVVKDKFDCIYKQLNTCLKKFVDIACKKDASSCLPWKHVEPFSLVMEYP